MDDRDDPPPPYFGNHPDGPYWSALRPPGEPDGEEEDYAVEGTTLRLMWDEGGGPLWGIEGLLPDDATWLQRALGLTEGLVADLIAWRDDMNDFRWGSHQDWRSVQKLLDQRAGALVGRLRSELGSRFDVRYHA